MTTTDPAAGLEAHDRELKEAVTRRDDLTAKALKANARAKAIGDELASLALKSPEQYDANSNPKPRSEAAKLAAEATAILQPAVSWQRRIGDVELEIRAARIARDQFVVSHIKELAAALEPKAHAAVDRIEAAIRELDDAIVGHARIAEAFTALLRPVSGLDPRTELPPADGLQRLRRDARRTVGEIPLPAPRSVLDVPGRPPLRVQSGSGWFSVGQAPAEAEVAA